MLVLFTFVSQAQAQHELHNIPPVIDPDGYNPDLLNPFIEPFAFDSDYQFFAPAESDFLDSEIEPNVGWYATYDRCWLFVTRPEQEQSRTQGDFTWGNRVDLGYMTEEDHGWLVSFMHINGPSEFNVLTQERINVVQGGDETTISEDTIILRGNPNAVTDPPNQTLPLRDLNDRATGERNYRLQDSLNNAKLNSFEFNKTFRLSPRHYGSIVEPFLGFRYFGFEDYFQRDVYSRFDLTTGQLLYTTAFFLVFPPPDFDNIGVEQLDRVHARFRNDMFGGQLGVRWYKQKSRWNLSGEVRAFAVQNFQSLNTTFFTERTIYDGGGPDSTVQVVLYEQTKTSANASEFVFGTEVRAEAAYELTRFIQLRAGMQFMDFGRGIGRGGNILDNDQDVILVGATFGVAVNR
jgi:hypothetical protein